MEFLLVIIGVILIISLIFIVPHLNPLTEDEVELLGNKKRNKQIRVYFSFDNGEYNVNKEFKKRMNPNGTFWGVNESLVGFPSIAAALLKYKKHEWIIIGFEKDKKVDLIWLNKGVDRSCVSPDLSVEYITKIAMPENHKSILIFHNHPNINPNYYDCRKPSSVDVKSANEFAKILNRYGVNLLEFVCERGRHYEYFLSPADTFLPLKEFIEVIHKTKGQSKLKNLSLHFERIF